MKRTLVYLFTIILGASIPIYFLLIWEPLKSEEVLSNTTISSSTDEDKEMNKSNEVLENIVDIETISLKQRDTSNTLFTYLDNDGKEKLNLVMKKLSIVDLVKVNDLFSDKENEEKIKEGVDLVKKRMSRYDYEIFKNILKNYIDPSILS